MTFERRAALIRKIEQLRGSRVVCLVTTLREGVPGSISDEHVRVFFDHLSRLPGRPVRKLDLFLVSNGGSTIVPWRLTALFREFAQWIGCLVPNRAYSAATMLALGADEIVMHPFGEMGPIDPTVQNAFNPKDNNRVLGISVEDVSAYVQFVKRTVGLSGDAEVVEALRALTDKVHPLALGNVERFISQSRMITRKILRTRVNRGDEATMEQLIENLASRLYFHAHPINRREAKQDLGLHVVDAAPRELEKAMWNLFREYETALEMRQRFSPLNELSRNVIVRMSRARSPVAAPAAVPPTGGGAAAASAPPASGPAGDTARVAHELQHSAIESSSLSSINYSKRVYTLTYSSKELREDVIEQGWRQVDAEARPRGSSGAATGGKKPGKRQRIAARGRSRTVSAARTR